MLKKSADKLEERDEENIEGKKESGFIHLPRAEKALYRVLFCSFALLVFTCPQDPGLASDIS